MSALRASSLIAVLILAGCSGQSGDVASPPTPLSAVQLANAPGFMPVSPGNHWIYDQAITLQIIPDNDPPGPPEHINGQIDVEQVEYRYIGTRKYVLEREIFTPDGGANEFLRRQDRAGYYIFERSKDDGSRQDRPTLSSPMRDVAERIAHAAGADVASIEAHIARAATVRRLLRGIDVAPNAGPPGGAGVGEITELAYPLHPGATWVIRELPLFYATVEARERINGFSAWRVRIDSELFGESDTVHFWYSRCGEVARRMQLESMAFTPDGTRIGIVISDEAVNVVDVNVTRGGCTVR